MISNSTQNSNFNYPAFVTPREAIPITGFSYEYLLAGCKDGTIPCKKIGKNYRINIYRYLEKLGVLPPYDKS